jgi:leader peptidase (prepilin peptidase)/N-methyltransferase
VVDVASQAGIDRAPLVRLLAGTCAVAVVAACAVRFGLGVETLFVAAFCVTLAVVSTIDIGTRRIPNQIVLPASAVGLAAVALMQPDHLGEALFAGVAAFAFFFVPGLISARWVGMGDAKLALLIGIVLGTDTLSALFVASIGGGLLAAASIALRGRAALTATFPFGPFLAAGAGLALIASGGTLYS